jgi:DNA polymerase/3'-5' exonuclease PolX
MFIRDAKEIADSLVASMRPHCLRAEIGGSIRRGRQDVKDIEIVAVPRWDDAGVNDLFGAVARTNRLHEWALGAEARGEVVWIKPGTSVVTPWQPKVHGRYWRGLVKGVIKLDLFLTTQAHFGLIHLIRTGSAEFSQGVMTYAKRRTCYRVEDGALKDKSGHVLETFAERDVFDALGLDYVEPHERTGFSAVKRKGSGVFA